MHANTDSTPRQQAVVLVTEQLGLLGYGTQGITYERMSEWAGRDVKRDSNFIALVKWQLLREYRKVLVSEKGRGYRILQPFEHAEYATKIDEQTERLSERRGRLVVEILDRTDIGLLSPTQQAQHALARASVVDKHEELIAFRRSQLEKNRAMLEAYGFKTPD